MTGTSADIDNGMANGWPSAAAQPGSAPVPWGALLATGIFSVAFGATVLLWPDVSLRVMSAVAGLWLVGAGIARIAGAFLTGAGGVAEHVLSGIVGVVALIAGLFCLRDLVSRLAVLALLFAVVWILSGITAVVLGLRRSGPARLGLVGVGVLSAAAGVVFLLMPDVSLATIVIVAGAGSLLVGLAEVVLALFLRSATARTRSADPGPEPSAG